MNNLLKRILVLTLVLSLIVLSGCSSNTQESTSGSSDATKANLRLGTTGATGVYYLVGTAFSQTMAKFYPTISMNVEVTGGSISNLQMLQSEDLDLGMALADIVSQASHGGTTSFPEPIELNAITAINEGLVHLIVSKESGIKSVGDLKGKKVATGQPGYVAEVTAFAILEANGIDIEKDCKWQRIGFSDAMDAIVDGRTDAIFYQAGAPVPSIVEASVTSGKVQVLPIDEETISKVVSDSEFLMMSTIPEDTYGNSTPIPTVCSINLMVCKPELDEAVVYNMLSTLYGNMDSWKDAHTSISFLKPETAVVGSPVAFHPGAIKYYEEIGVMQ